MKPVLSGTRFPDPPALAGIYVAQPVRMEPVPVSRDPRYIATCARVNCRNVKVGKARNLASRRRDYVRDFGQDNISFYPLLATEESGRAESLILHGLKAYRMRSPKGGLMDWLSGVSMEAVMAAVFSTLDEAGIPYKPLVDCKV
ncbi:hypothetical protein [Dokdonella sp.]|uniref:hypothetical protein n=1 Tax=Dokdonella sp. TaxID=2291710 RepID=UPI00352954A8